MIEKHFKIFEITELKPNLTIFLETKNRFKLFPLIIWNIGWSLPPLLPPNH